MYESYLPTREANLRSFLANLDDYVTANSASIGIDEKLLGELNSAVTAWVDLFDVCESPATRTPVKIEEKQTQKPITVAKVREVVNVIQAFPGTTNGAREAMNLTIPDDENTPIPVPASSPQVSVLGVRNRQATIEIANADGSRAKPFGVKGACVFTYVGASVPTDPMAWRMTLLTTKRKADVVFPLDTPAGATVWITACWTNTKLQNGPVANAVSTNLPGGMAQAA